MIIILYDIILYYMTYITLDHTNYITPSPPTKSCPIKSP